MRALPLLLFSLCLLPSLLLFSLCLLPSLPSLAQSAQKCVGKNGQITYSGGACPLGFEEESISTIPDGPKRMARPVAPGAAPAAEGKNPADTNPPRSSACGRIEQVVYDERKANILLFTSERDKMLGEIEALQTIQKKGIADPAANREALQQIAGLKGQLRDPIQESDLIAIERKKELLALCAKPAPKPAEKTEAPKETQKPKF